MSDSDKTSKTDKKVFDVADPSTTPADATSKPVIVNHGPIMRDTILVDQDHEGTEQTDSEPVSVAVHSVNIKPVEVKAPEPDSPDPEPKTDESAVQQQTSNDNSESETKEEVKPEVATTESAGEPSAAELKKQEEEAKAAADRQAQLDGLIDSGKFFLPINMVEKRKNRRWVIVGIVVCLLLAVAWVDAALDAGIISNSLHLPHTHFFALKS